MLKSIYLQQVYSDLAARDPEQKEFHQAVREVLESLDLMIDSHPEYLEAALLIRSFSIPRPRRWSGSWSRSGWWPSVSRGWMIPAAFG